MALSGKRGRLLMLAALGSVVTLVGAAPAQEFRPPASHTASHSASHTSMAQKTMHASQGKYQVNSLSFKLPFKIDPRTLLNVQEIQLWSCDDKGVWLIMDRVSPAAGYFMCRVGQDGEYGFSIVTVDATGHVQPADVTRRRPEILVVVQARSEAPASPFSPLSSLVTELPIKAHDSEAPLVPPAPAKQQAATPRPEKPIPLAPDLPKATAGETIEIVSETPLAMAKIERSAQASSSGTSFGAAPVSTSTTILINSMQVNVDYNINRKGPSGVSKVEIFGTTDGGRTWRRFGEDADGMSPADVTLPGEGVFGLRLVGINGNGFGKSPAVGAHPTTNVEVDCTRPKIQSWKVSPIKQGKLEIQWLVQDKNLGNDPVSLYYARERNGTWKPLCKKLKGEGVFQAPVPSDATDQISIRLEAIDLAGNVSTCESQEPLIIDRLEPEINVVGITVTLRASAGERVVPASK